MVMQQESRPRWYTPTRAIGQEREASPPPLPSPSAPPSAGAFRMALTTCTLVVSGLLAGTGLYDALRGGATEGWRAAAAVAGVAAVVLLACAMLLAVPSSVRCRLRLKEAGRPFAPALWAVSELAAAEGTRVHGVLIGPATLTEPFWTGRPGDYRIVLPPELARLGDPALFRTLVRRELARLARHDVALSWLADSLRYVVAPLLALPVVVELAHGEVQVVAARIWPSAVLIVVAALLVRAWRAAPAWRPAVLSPVDGIALGLLATLALPLAAEVAAPVAHGRAVLFGALVVGSAFGATIGHGLWRQALVGPIAQPTRSVALGVLAGGMLAELASLPGPGPDLTALSAAVPVALAGATAFIGGLGALWVRGGVRAHRSAVACAAVTAAALVWAAQEARLVLQDGGAALLAAWLAAPSTLLLPGAAAVLLAGAAAWRPRAAQTGLTGLSRRAEHPRREAVLVGLCGGVGGGLGLVGYRVAVGPPGAADVLPHHLTTVLGAALVGAVAVALLALGRGATGIGAGLLAGPLATVITGLAALAVDAVEGGDPLPSAWPLLGAAVSAGFALNAAAALVGLLRAPRLCAKTR